MRVRIVEPVSRQQNEVRVNFHSSVFRIVIERAVNLFTFAFELAGVDLVVRRMELLLLPPVAVRTPILQSATVRVRFDVLVDLPILTQIRRILVNLRFAPEVLPVVGINTHFFVMVVVPRAPLRLKIEHVELSVLGLIRVQQFDRDFVFGVGKGA